MRLIALTLIWWIASVAYGQSQIVQKPIPPVAAKAEAGDKKENPPAQRQEITVTLPSSVNVNLGGKLDVKSASEEKRGSEEPSKWVDPITWFTLVLAVANILLWRATSGIVSEAKTASGIARDAANAAKESADASIKSAMPVLFPYITDMLRLHPLEASDTPITHDANIFIGFDNYGKTPGIIQEVRAKLFLTIRDELPTVNVNELPVHSYPVWVAGEARGKDLITGALDLKQTITFTPIELRELIAEASGQYRRIALIGKVVYDDLFGSRHTSQFCLKVRLWKVGFLLPNQPQIRAFQVAQGGSAYNRIISEKIPKPDPLAGAGGKGSY